MAMIASLFRPAVADDHRRGVTVPRSQGAHRTRSPSLDNHSSTVPSAKRTTQLPFRSPLTNGSSLTVPSALGTTSVSDRGGAMNPAWARRTLAGHREMSGAWVLRASSIAP